MVTRRVTKARSRYTSKKYKSKPRSYSKPRKSSYKKRSSRPVKRFVKAKGGSRSFFRTL